MKKNADCPELEKLDKEEFILDFSERDRLIAEADVRIDAVRKNIEAENYTKGIIKQRIKAECWDSMEVVGQVVKSFNPDNLMGRVEVQNYPICKRSAWQRQSVDKMIMLRKIELAVSAEMNPIEEEIVVENDMGDDEFGI